MRFSLPSIIITITSNEPWNTETHKTDRNPPITNHKPWPFEPVKVKFCFLRGPLRWLTAAKNAIVRGWSLNFTIRVFVKSAVTKDVRFGKKTTTLIANGEYLSVFKCGFTQVGRTFLQLCLDVLFSSKGYLTSHPYFKKSHWPNIALTPKQNKPNRKRIILQYAFLSFFSDCPL